MTDAEILEIMDTYPDTVAKAKEAWQLATAARERTFARLYLTLKANSAEKKVTTEELKAKVRDSEEHFKAVQDEIMAESAYNLAYETLMSAKKQAGLRAAF